MVEKKPFFFSLDAELNTRLHLGVVLKEFLRFIAHFLDKGENKLNIFKITQRYQHFQGSEKIQLLSAKN